MLATRLYAGLDTTAPSGRPTPPTPPTRLPPTGQQRAIRDLETGTLQSNLRFWRSLDQRCLRTNRHFKHVQHGDTVGHVVATLDATLLDRLLADPDEPFRCADVHRLKHSASSTVIELPATTTALGKPLILKRFAVTRWSDPFVSLLRPTPALRSFVLGHGLDLRCLPTPRPLAVLHRCANGLTRRLSAHREN